MAVRVPDKLLRRWELAYRRYGSVSASVARTAEVDMGAARVMAVASWDVAEAWRDIATVSGLPWWVLAAVDAASAAFELQGSDWDARSGKEKGIGE